MTDETSLAPLAKKPQVKMVGGKRATLAFLLSLVAVVAAAYAVWLAKFDAVNDRVIAPLQHADNSAAIKAELESNLLAQQNTLALINDEIKNLKSALEKIPAVEAPKAAPAISTDALADIQKKILEMEAKAGVAASEMQGELSRKTKTLVSLAVLDHVARRMQQGLSFAGDVKDMEASLPATQPMQDAFNLLKNAAEQSLFSDHDLLEELRGLLPDFLAKEKMAGADNVLDKVVIQLQKLVVVRPKDGKINKDTPVANALAALDRAMVTGEWENALKLAEALQDKAPKDYAAWLQRLKNRAIAEGALAGLRKGLFADLYNDKNMESLAP